MTTSMSGSYREQEAEQLTPDVAEEGSPFSPQCPPRLWPSCAADGAIRTALALPLRGASPILHLTSSTVHRARPRNSSTTVPGAADLGVGGSRERARARAWNHEE